MTCDHCPCANRDTKNLFFSCGPSAAVYACPHGALYAAVKQVVWGVKVEVFEKKCPDCGNLSYSASDTGSWTCPFCGRDLADVRPRVPGSSWEPERAKEPGEEE